ncbi:porin [Rugamonas apoptosis]|uniref:Porin n=1 Tax=Rugamonas apoptosis TaxID=2758570 RepID=A0A7W2FFF3_9BURK|nr:porin [Rugamonas apoptosis]MBA5690659.1 porin [Rugamonas apoptosis]
MQYKIFTAAALSLATLPAYAQSNVSIYGLLDSALVMSQGGPSGTTTKLESGVSNGSRIGFRGTEDLGNGMSALFTLEAGLLLDTGASDQNGTLFGRQAYTGLKGNFGAVTMGRQYTPIYNTLVQVDPFSNNYGGAAGQLMAGEKAGTRMNNTVMYATPTLQGFSAQAAYGFGEVAGNSAKSRQIGGSVSYEAGRLLLRGAFNRTTNATATDSARNVLLIAKYDFGPVIGSIGYGDNKGTGLTDSRDYIVGVTVPFGVQSLMANAVHKTDRANTHLGANQLALVYSYALSKRTNWYMGAAKLSNTRFTTTKFGAGDTEYDLGIKHTF